MIRRALTLCFVLLCMASHVSVIHAEAIGEWQVYPSYTIATKNVVVGSTVYSLMNGNLLRYDTEDTSVRTYDCLNDLNDVHISHMAYCDATKRLILVYDNGNIDLMDADDNVVNISALKDKSMNDKAVSSVYINGTNAYLTTGFGFIIVDTKEGVIRNTYQLGLNTTAMVISDGLYVLATTTGIYKASVDANLYESSVLTRTSTADRVLQMVEFDGSVWIRRSDAIYKVLKAGVSKFEAGTFNYLKVFSDGTMAFGNATTTHLLTSETQRRVLSGANNWSDLTRQANTYWGSDGLGGLKGYRIEGDAFVQSVGPIQPNSPVRDLFYRMHYEGDRLLVAGGINTPYAIYNDATAMYYEDGVWFNFDESIPAQQYPSIRHWNTTNLVQDPNDPSHHFASPYRTGLYEYRDGKLVGLYNCDNAPFETIADLGVNFVGCSSLKFDSDGNLWMTNQGTDTIIRVLRPNMKWQALYYSEIAKTPTCDDYCFTSSGINFLVSRRINGRGFFGFDTNGTLTNTRDDKHLLRTSITNEDGTTYTPDEFYCMAEDLKGQVWCGTNLGLFVIEDPTKFFDQDFTFEQIKIARDDDSGLADYLLSGVPISCIAVDGANRKWIGTNSNGIYLVSADGQDMIHHFMAEDSPLLSNNIRCIAIHPSTGRVMIGTDVGLCSYMADAVDAEDELDYDNLLVYPNPVRPDYHGPITIDGLSADCEIKICSSTGQLIMSGVSNGGRFTWNGCNRQGKRVASGVYQVIANTANGKSAVVTRIVVIR